MINKIEEAVNATNIGTNVIFNRAKAEQMSIKELRTYFSKELSILNQLTKELY